MSRAPQYHKPKTDLFYADDEVYAVEIGDRIEFVGDGQFGPATHCGEITAIYPRKAAVKASYLDETDWTREGEPKRKVTVVPLAEVTFMGRVW